MKLQKINLKLNKIAINFIAILSTIILVCLSISLVFIQANFKNTNYLDYHEGIYYTFKNIPLTILGILILFGIFYFLYNLCKKINTKILLIISLIFISLFSIFWVNAIQAPVKADQKFVLACAIALKNNDYHFLEEGQYLFMHPLQLGIVYFLRILIIFSESPLFIQNINIIFTLFCFYLLYKICKLIFNTENNIKMILLLFPSFVVLPMLCVMVYGNIFGFTFALLALFLLLYYCQNRKIRYLVLASFSLTLSIILKNNYEIILIAFIISLILDCINKFDYKNILIILLSLILFFTSNKLIINYTEHVIKSDVNEGIPMIAYVAMGIEQPITRSAGWYNEGKNVETIYSDNNYDLDLTKQESTDIIKSRIKEFINSPQNCIKFYADKILSTWCEPSFQGIWSAEPLDEFSNTSTEYQNYLSNNKIVISIFQGKLHTLINYYLSIFNILVFGTTTVSTIYNIKKQKFDYKNIILLLCFLGGFLFHILWETKCIYVIPFYFLLLPYSAEGFTIIFELINKKLINKKNNKFTNKERI